MVKYRQEIDLETSIKMSSLCWEYESTCWFVLKGVAIGRFLWRNRDTILKLVFSILLIVGGALSAITLWRKFKKLAKIMIAMPENASPWKVLPVNETLPPDEQPAEPLTSISLQLSFDSTDTIDQRPLAQNGIPVEQETEQPKPWTEPTGTPLKSTRTRILNYKTRQVVGIHKKDQQQAKSPKGASITRFPVVKKPSVRLAITKSPVKLPITKAPVMSIPSKPPANRFRNTSLGNQAKTKETINPATLKAPVNDSPNKDPVNRFRNTSLGNQPKTKEPCNSAILKTPVNAFITKDLAKLTKTKLMVNMTETKDSVHPGKQPVKPYPRRGFSESPDRSNGPPLKQAPVNESGIGASEAMAETKDTVKTDKQPFKPHPRRGFSVSPVRPPLKEPLSKQAPVNQFGIGASENMTETEDTFNPGNKPTTKPHPRRGFSVSPVRSKEPPSKQAPVNQFGIGASEAMAETKDTVKTDKQPFKPHPRRGFSVSPVRSNVPRVWKV